MNIKRFLSCALLVMAFASMSFAQQNSWTTTTLNGAITSTGTTTIQLTSSTNVAANTTSLFINGEMMSVLQILNSSTGLLKVQRGAGGTRAVTHQNSTLVWIGLNGWFTTNPQTPAKIGSCTPANETILPAINTVTNTFSNCLGGPSNGRWVNGLNAQYPKYRIAAPEPGAVAYTSINTNGTALTATTLYCTEIFIPTTKLLTGLAILNGTTVGTDLHYVALYPAATGTAVAYSALAGATSANASTYQTYAFTSGNITGGQYLAVGPASYFGCVQSNSNTDNLRMVLTGINDNLLTKGQTGAVFGTLPTLTIPTAFASAVGPYIIAY